MNKTIQTQRVPISQLKEWSENPRSITKENFERLKRQITTLGVYQPLIVNEDMVVLSGNMRLKAFRDLKIDPIWVTIVQARTKSKMLEYALSANDLVGEYREEDLADLLLHSDEEIPLQDYKITIKDISLEKLLKQFGPGDEFSSDDDTNEEKKKVCPNCGYEL